MCRDTPGENDMRIFVLALCASLISACASSSVMVSDAQIAAFERAKTTESEVIARLGPPTTVINDNGQHTLMYSGAQMQARLNAGPLVGGTDVRASSVMLRFGPDGKLIDIISLQQASGTTMGLEAMTVTPLEMKP